jgi:hypothetical protein
MPLFAGSDFNIVCSRREKPKINAAPALRAASATFEPRKGLKGDCRF